MAKSAKPVETGHLTLGWQVTQTGDPRYWLSTDARPGDQEPEDLVRVTAKALGTHAAIIAQSGSGKSFFVGRLIEELTLATKARCVILDSNADFRKIHEVVDETLWKAASYDTRVRRGLLPHERSRLIFADAWKRISIRVRTSSPPFDEPYAALQLWWPDIAPEFLAEDVEPMLRSDFYHCHAFVRAVAELVALKPRGPRADLANVIDTAEKLLPEGRKLGAGFVHRLQAEFVPAELEKSESARLSHFGIEQRWLSGFSRGRVERFIKRAAAAPSYISEDVERFYFGKAREYEAAGILRRSARDGSAGSEPPRIEVLDLPSLPDKSTRLLAVNAAVAAEWEAARRRWAVALQQSSSDDDRVPTFIVIDEAHNLIPADARGKAEIALREQFRTIVAEGRKYGLFLILASQRPDKLDPLVLSECENKVVMRLSSGSVLEITQKMLGLDDVSPRLLEKCLEFELGRGLLLGPWAVDGPTPFYAAARRTAEGGRNLRSSHWAVPASASGPGIAKKRRQRKPPKRRGQRRAKD
jgi:hypothetical protein